MLAGRCAADPNCTAMLQGIGISIEPGAAGPLRWEHVPSLPPARVQRACGARGARPPRGARAKRCMHVQALAPCAPFNRNACCRAANNMTMFKGGPGPPLNMSSGQVAQNTVTYLKNGAAVVPLSASWSASGSDTDILSPSPANGQDVSGEPSSGALSAGAIAGGPPHQPALAQCKREGGNRPGCLPARVPPNSLLGLHGLCRTAGVFGLLALAASALLCLTSAAAPTAQASSWGLQPGRPSWLLARRWFSSGAASAPCAADRRRNQAPASKQTPHTAASLATRPGAVAARAPAKAAAQAGLWRCPPTGGLRWSMTYMLAAPLEHVALHRALVQEGCPPHAFRLPSMSMKACMRWQGWRPAFRNRWAGSIGRRKQQQQQQRVLWLLLAAYTQHAQETGSLSTVPVWGL